MRYPETASLIRSARRRKGLSQEGLAQQIGSSRLQVIRWEQGLHRPDMDNLGAKLAAALGIDPADLRAADGVDEDDEEAAPMAPFVKGLAEVLAAEVARAVAAQVAIQIAALQQEVAA